MSEYSRTYATHPELWDEGISFLAKLEYANGTQRTVASGWHLRQIEFENPTVSFQDHDSGFGCIDIGANTRTQDSLWANVTKFEIEISLNDGQFDSATQVLGNLLGTSLAGEFIESMKSMIHRVSANRSNALIRNADGSEINTVDLLAQNLPARSGNTDDPLRALYRWCRIFELPNGTVTIYEPISDENMENLRWPHNGIWLNRGPGYYQNSSNLGSIVNAVEVPIKYEKYNLENWRIEFDFWENQPFQIVISDDSVVASNRLGAAQRELGVLSQFVTTAFLSARNLERRSKTNQLLLGNPDVLEMIDAYLPKLLTTIDEYRGMLYRASGLLANTAQSVQAVVDQKNVEATQRMNTFLTFASAVFFIPTLIISFYSMSIIGINESEPVPSSMTVLLICIASIVVSLVVVFGFRLLRKKTM